MTFTPIDGPIRVVPTEHVPGQYIAVDRLGHFLASGTERALSQMADAFNKGQEFDGGELEPVTVSSCPECGYPKESEEQATCLKCAAPPPPEVEEKVEKKAEIEEWF